jgi:hypothetical protein
MGAGRVCTQRRASGQPFEGHNAVHKNGGYRAELTDGGWCSSARAAMRWSTMVLGRTCKTGRCYVSDGNSWEMPDGAHVRRQARAVDWVPKGVHGRQDRGRPMASLAGSWDAARHGICDGGPRGQEHGRCAVRLGKKAI